MVVEEVGPLDLDRDGGRDFIYFFCDNVKFQFFFLFF